MLTHWFFKGYEFADDEYDPEEADQIAQALKEEGTARAVVERQKLVAEGTVQNI